MVNKFREVFVLPTIVELIPEADAENPSDEHDIFYNEHCTNLIKARLEEKKAAGQIVELLTQYPGDEVTDEYDSRDTVSLNHDGDVIVLDWGDDG